MDTLRTLVEGFLRGRYGYERDRAFRVLALAVLIGAILVAGWLLVGQPMIARFSPATPVVRNGVAAVMVCGEKAGKDSSTNWLQLPLSGWLGVETFKGVEAEMDAAMDYVPEPQTGTWSVERRGDCNVFYHHAPVASQRENRQLRAQQESEEFQEMPVVEKLPYVR